jgi:UDP-N-acetylglucosamine diphosphorylase / glucose-1-phosphate thymidylyltransferase / UDP-N-acetylgalactosamine diphosphorylase / glucosamine-1-phosphate N-acetyltransferase / galactosamine-1-phosphate N-acetyltransferase
MVDNICIFEGIYYTRLLPLVYFRPQYDLRCGILSLREKVLKQFPDIPASLHCRGYLSDLLKQQNPNVYVNEIKGSSCLFINGNVIASKNFRDKISLEGEDKLYVKGDTVIAAKVSGGKLDSLKHQLSDLYTLSDFNDLAKEEIDVKVVSYPWDLIGNNGAQIIEDFNLLTGSVKGNKIKGQVYEGAYLINKENIFIDEGAKIKPGAVLDAEEGPIYIGKNVIVYSNATIEGPAYIGDNSKIKIGAKIYEETSIGPVCKVGGEVEASIIHSYSNKQHDGFLGHSYLGMWVNLGADTNNSDLKNNYGSVKVVINGEQVDSNSMFVGLTMGDHSKSAINTMFNTGTVVGVSSNIFGGSFPSKYIPSFSWGGSEALTSYDLERSIEVAKRVMNRRKIEMTEIDERLFRKIFDLTKEERRKRGMPN